MTLSGISSFTCSRNMSLAVLWVLVALFCCSCGAGKRTNLNATSLNVTDTVSFTPVVTGSLINQSSTASSTAPSFSRQTVSQSTSMEINASRTPSGSQTTTLSASVPVMPSATHSATKDPNKVPCGGLVAVVSMQILYPSVEPAVTGTLILHASIVALYGYLVAFNITTCHTFTSEALPDVYYNKTSAASSSISYAISTNVEQSEPLYGFVSIMKSDHDFVRFTLETPTSMVVRIGPNSNYGVYAQSESLIVFVGRTSFSPVSAFSVSMSLIILPLTLGISDEGSATMKQGSMVLSILALAMSNPSTATLVGRVDMLTNAMSCPNYLSESTLSMDQNPTNAGFGTEKKLYHHNGAILLNPVLVMGILLFHFFFALMCCLWGYTFGGALQHFVHALSFAHFPSYTVAAVTFLFQGTVSSSVTVLLYSNSAFYSFVASFVLLTELCIPFVVLLMTTGSRFQALRASTESPSTRTTAVEKYIVGTGMWIDRTKKLPGFVEMYGSLFEEYRPKRQWFLAVELAFLFVFGILNAISPKTKLRCLINSVCQSLVLWCYLIVLVGMHPQHCTTSFAFFIVVSFLQVIASILVMASFLVPANRKESLNAAAAVCLLISVIISMVKMVHEMGIVVFEFWLSESREENVVRWKAEAKRKAKTARMKKQRELHIRKILEDNADYEGVFDEVLNPADDDGGGSTADSLAVEDCDERAAQKIESSVRPVVDCSEPTEEEETFFVSTTGLRKQDLFKSL